MASRGETRARNPLLLLPELMLAEVPDLYTLDLETLR